MKKCLTGILTAFAVIVNSICFSAYASECSNISYSYVNKSDYGFNSSFDGLADIDGTLLEAQVTVGYDKPLKFVSLLYENDKLVAASVNSDITDSPDGKKIYKTRIDPDKAKNFAACTVNTFLWESFDSMKAICNSVIYPSDSAMSLVDIKVETDASDEKIVINPDEENKAVYNEVTGEYDIVVPIPLNTTVPPAVTASAMDNGTKVEFDNPQSGDAFPGSAAITLSGIDGKDKKTYRLKYNIGDVFGENDIMPATSAADMTDGVSFVIYNEYKYMTNRYEKTYDSSIFELDSEGDYIPQEVSFNINWTDCTTIAIVIPEDENSSEDVIGGVSKWVDDRGVISDYDYSKSNGMKYMEGAVSAYGQRSANTPVSAGSEKVAVFKATQNSDEGYRTGSRGCTDRWPAYDSSNPDIHGCITVDNLEEDLLGWNYFTTSVYTAGVKETKLTLNRPAKIVVLSNAAQPAGFELKGESKAVETIQNGISPITQAFLIKKFGADSSDFFSKRGKSNVVGVRRDYLLRELVKYQQDVLHVTGNNAYRGYNFRFTDDYLNRFGYDKTDSNYSLYRIGARDKNGSLSIDALTKKWAENVITHY